ncbi:hypothetical protein EDD85DRAFT_784872 [Armillaria nabsnona]|nr:hypothetical protein EDD85DRAFT_784872 [Armillaria nabsnona]
MSYWFSVKGLKSIMDLALARSISGYFLVLLLGQSEGSPCLRGTGRNKPLKLFVALARGSGGREHACTQYRFNVAGEMVFTTELANKGVGSEAWMYQSVTTISWYLLESLQKMPGYIMRSSFIDEASDPNTSSDCTAIFWKQ